MLDLVFASSLSSAALTSGAACPDDFVSAEYHLADVCSAWLKGAPAYSATFRASLNPRPASHQVLIYRRDDTWFMRIAGYRRGLSGSEVVTRRNEVAVSDVDVEALASRVTKASLERLSAMPYYGSENMICTDGADLQLAMSSTGKKYVAAQHSCAGKTEINEIAATFRQLALKYDPDFAGLLTGLQD